MSSQISTDTAMCRMIKPYHLIYQYLVLQQSQSQSGRDVFSAEIRKFMLWP